MSTKTAILTNKKSTKITLYKDWRFWYKLGAAIVILSILLSALIVDLVALSTLKSSVDQWLINNPEITKNPNFWEEFNRVFSDSKNKDWLTISQNNPSVSQMNYGGFIIAHFSYFTVLSNLAIGIWFLLATIKFSNEGKVGYIGYRPTIILTTFITITMIIWLGLLMPTNLANGQKMSTVDWFYGLTEHALFPLLFISYVAVVFKTDSPLMNSKSYIKKEWKNIIFILLIYGAYCLIRGEIRYQGNQPIATQYPYFFFQIHDGKVNGFPGIVWFAIALFSIALIAMLFSLFYNFLICKRLNNTRINQIRA